MAVTAGLLAAPIVSRAQQIVPAQSDIAFVGKQLGVPVDGKFRKWTAQIKFDPKKPEAGSVSFTIDTASATIGAAEFDAELAKPEWFSAAKFPQAAFQSQAIKGLGGGRFAVTGTLTMKGVMRPVEVPVQVVQAGANSTATGSFTLKRLAFKIGDGDWADTSTVVDEVTVKFKLSMTGMAPL